MKKARLAQLLLPVLLILTVAYAALVVPTDVQQPGTQPGEISNLQSPDKCDNCHGGYDPAVEPAYNWRGSMMAQAGRDPIFWATLAVAEQDFDGVGDLCLRCHSPAGWLGGRSTPTDGSDLAAGDADGVECDFCHKMTNPDNSEHVGVQNPPFVANDGGSPPVGYYGSGMYAMWSGSEKLGPFTDADAKHQMKASAFHRSRDFCGTCHDVSNPAVGDLAHNNGAQVPLAPGTFSGVPGAPVTDKAAFNNFPYAYGIVERTYSEHKASLLSRTLVSEYPTLPPELQDGALQAAYESAIVAGKGGDYANSTPRYFSCQTCHVPPVTGQGCNKNPPVRQDLPLHDMTGGNYWMPDAIAYLDGGGKLRLGGGLDPTQLAAIADGKTRAQQQLNMAASLAVSGNVVRVVNLTAHKLISGYPEGRRMWLNVKWYDGDGALIREDGEYGLLAVQIDEQPVQVETILDLDGSNTKIYEAHYGMTQQWAGQLLALGYPADLALAYDRVTGEVSYTLGQLAEEPAGTHHETFHFVLNNCIVKDNRIPPYEMDYDKAAARNALPVPADQYGAPESGGSFNYYDDFGLTPPPLAVTATIDLLYQPTSWEYVQFLYLANDGQSPFLAQEGAYLLEAWLATGMAAPHTMATANWQMPGPPPTVTAVVVNRGAAQRSRIREIAVQFDQDVSASIAAGDLTLFDETNGQNVDTSAAAVSYDAPTNTATWNLSAVALGDAFYTAKLSATAVTNANGTGLDGDGDNLPGGDWTHLFHKLGGDANGDAMVNVGDQGILGANYGASGNWWQLPGDVNADGMVNVGDLGIIGANYGAALSGYP